MPRTNAKSQSHVFHVCNYFIFVIQHEIVHQSVFQIAGFRLVRREKKQLIRQGFYNELQKSNVLHQQSFVFFELESKAIGIIDGGLRKISVAEHGVNANPAVKHQAGQTRSGFYQSSDQLLFKLKYSLTIAKMLRILLTVWRLLPDRVAWHSTKFLRVLSGIRLHQ